MAGISRVIVERDQMNTVFLSEVNQPAVGPDLVTLVGRVRDPVNEIEDIHRRGRQDFPGLFSFAAAVFVTTQPSTRTPE